jgi:tetratricopeptide (TPR) repeat protein
VHIDEIPKRANGWIPIRDHLGITAFGINAWTKRSTDDAVIVPHAEDSTGHEELYLVFRGHATYVVDDKEVDAPEGTILFVGDPSVRRGAQPVDDDTIVLTLGGKPGEPFAVSDWEASGEWNARAFPHYQEQRYAEAAAVLREGIAAGVDNAGMHYNLACFLALAGERDEALEHLQQALREDRGLAEVARGDSDLESLRDDPRFPD